MSSSAVGSSIEPTTECQLMPGVLRLLNIYRVLKRSIDAGIVSIIRSSKSRLADLCGDLKSLACRLFRGRFLHSAMPASGGRRLALLLYDPPGDVWDVGACLLSNDAPEGIVP